MKVVQLGRTDKLGRGGGAGEGAGRGGNPGKKKMILFKEPH